MQVLDHLKNQRLQVRLVQLQGVAEPVGPQQLEHPLHRAGQSPTGVLDAVDPGPFGRGGIRTLREPPQVRHALDHRDRRVQLMAGDLNKGPLQAVRLPQPGVLLLKLTNQLPASTSRS